MRRLKAFLMFLISAVLFLTLLQAPVSAQTAQEIEQMSILGNWPQYVPGDGPIGVCVQQTGPPGGQYGDSGAEGDNVRIAYEFFVGKGLAPFRSAGIVGNLWVESGVDPNSNQNGGGPGRGIAQWSVNQRWRELQQFARQRGGNERDLNVQLEFLWYEMTSVPPWNQTLPAVQGATTMNGPNGATFQFMDKFEKPGVPHLDRREAAATNILQLYGNGASPGGPAAPAAGGGSQAPSTGAQGAAVGGACPTAAGVGGFTGAPGQTKPLGRGFTLNENTDYSATPCAPGSTETQVYRHPTAGFQIRLCRIGSTSVIVASIVSDRVVAMFNAASRQGIVLNGGGFRDYEGQIRARINNGCNVPMGPSNAGCSPPTAVPGNSQHERGLAIDFTGPGGGTLRRGTAPFNWLTQNAAQFGFFNLPSESWHWSTSGN